MSLDDVIKADTKKRPSGRAGAKSAPFAPRAARGFRARGPGGKVIAKAKASTKVDDTETKLNCSLEDVIKHQAKGQSKGATRPRGVGRLTLPKLARSRLAQGRGPRSTGGAKGGKQVSAALTPRGGKVVRFTPWASKQGQAKASAKVDDAWSKWPKTAKTDDQDYAAQDRQWTKQGGSWYGSKAKAWEESTPRAREKPYSWHDDREEWGEAEGYSWKENGQKKTDDWNSGWSSKASSRWEDRAPTWERTTRESRAQWEDEEDTWHGSRGEATGKAKSWYEAVREEAKKWSKNKGVVNKGLRKRSEPEAPSASRQDRQDFATRQETQEAQEARPDRRRQERGPAPRQPNHASQPTDTWRQRETSFPARGEREPEVKPAPRVRPELKRRRPSPRPEDDATNVEVSNIPLDLTTADIRYAFETQAGEILSCRLDRGVALIRFRRFEAARRAVDTFDRGELNGRRIQVEMV